MGAQDSLSQAEDFIADTGTESLTMIWDESFESWSYYGVRGQPTVVLVDSVGQPLGAWTGAIPEDEILSLVAGA